MNYQETLEWLFNRLPMYQNQGTKAYKANLNNITQLCSALGNPQQKFKSVHIAGTNGKGSTAHMLASVFIEAGYKTGLHTSPHLKDFTERSRINGQSMSQDFVVSFVQKNQHLIESVDASFFEVSVAMGFAYFAEQNVDIAIMETGLGGRLDSTNIIQPELSIITQIGFDHKAILGDTLAQIAAEKAGIIKKNTPVVIGEHTPVTKPVFEAKASLEQAPIYFASDMETSSYATDLKGGYQIKNAKTATVALQILQQNGWKISTDDIKNGFSHVVQNTQLRGRWETLGENPLIVADTAHNPPGIAEVVKQIKQTPYHALHLVLGFVKDKDVTEILSYFPKEAHYYFCAPQVPRKLPLDELENMAHFQHQSFYSSVAEAMNAAVQNANVQDMVFVGGSTFVVAEAL